MKRKKVAPRQRISRRFAEIQKEFEPVEYNFTYWLLHALHWHAFMCAVVAIFGVGFVLTS